MIPGDLIVMKDRARLIRWYVPVQPNGWPLEGPVQRLQGPTCAVVVSSIEHRGSRDGDDFHVTYVVTSQGVGWAFDWSVEMRSSDAT